MSTTDSRLALTDEQVVKALGQGIGAQVDSLARARGDAAPLAFILLVWNPNDGTVRRVANVDDAGAMSSLAAVLAQLVEERAATVGKPAVAAKKIVLDS